MSKSKHTLAAKFSAQFNFNPGYGGKSLARFVQTLPPSRRANLGIAKTVGDVVHFTDMSFFEIPPAKDSPSTPSAA